MAATHHIRTWKRLSRNSSLPVEERVTETTHHHGDPEQAIRQADFITIPRAEYGGSDRHPHQAYTRPYAEHVAEVLAEAYGFAGRVRISQSGRSYVFERESAPEGIDFDFGIRAQAAPRPAMDGMATA